MQRRNWRARAIVAVVVTAISALGVSGAPSAGADDEGIPDAAVNDAVLMAPEWHVSVDEAARRIRLQDEIGALGVEAANRWPASYGGIWIDHDRGGRVSIAFTEDAARRVSELARDFSEPQLLHAIPVIRPQHDLDDLLTRMAADREEAWAGRLAFPGVEDGEYDLAVDARRNTVVVRVDEMEPDTQGAFASRYGGHVVVEATGIMRPAACTISDCRSTLRSGLQTVGSGGCSTAFTVASGSTRNILSAAHCSGSSRSHGFSTYGSVALQQQSGRVDGERHTVTSNGFYAGAWLWVSSSETARPITSTGTWASLAVGASVCKTGATTSNTCGTVTNTNVSLTYVPSSDRFVESTMCARPGDSGAGVYSANKALGIMSGSTATTTCTSSDRSVFGHIEYAQNALGYNVVTSEGAPGFSSVSGASNLGSTITATFGKPIRCSSAHTFDFSVKINGQLNYSVTNVACSNDSDSTLVLTVGTPFVGGTTVAVRTESTLEDVGGNDVSLFVTRTTNVSV